MKLLHSQSQKEVHRFLYNVHQKLTPASHSWLFIGHFGASKLGGGGGGGTSLKEANGDAPLDGFAFSRLD